MNILTLQEIAHNDDDFEYHFISGPEDLDYDHVYYKDNYFTGILRIEDGLQGCEHTYYVPILNQEGQETTEFNLEKYEPVISKYVFLDGQVLFSQHYRTTQKIPFCKSIYLTSKRSRTFRLNYYNFPIGNGNINLYYYPNGDFKKIETIKTEDDSEFIENYLNRLKVFPKKYLYLNQISIKYYPNNRLKEEKLENKAIFKTHYTDKSKIICFLAHNFNSFFKTKKIFDERGILCSYQYKLNDSKTKIKSAWKNFEYISNNRFEICKNIFDLMIDKWIFKPLIENEYIQNINTAYPFLSKFHLNSHAEPKFGLSENRILKEETLHKSKKEVIHYHDIYYGMNISSNLRCIEHNNNSNSLNNYEYIYSIPRIYREKYFSEKNKKYKTITQHTYLVEFGIVYLSETYTEAASSDITDISSKSKDFMLSLNSPDGLRLQRYRNWLQQACLHLNLSTDLNQPSMYWPLNAPPLLSEAGNLQKIPNQFKVQGTPSFISRLIHNQLIVESNERFDTLLEELDDQGQLSKQTYLLHGEKVWSEFEPLLLYFFVSATGPEELIRIEKEWNAEGHLQRLKRYEHGILTLQQSFDHSGKLLYEKNSAQNPELREQLQLLWGKELLVPLPDTLEAIPIEQAENNGNYCFYKGHPYSGFVKNETEEYRARLLYNYGMLMGFEIRSQDKGAGLRGFGSEQFYFQTEWGEGEACREEVFEFGICISRKVRNEAGEILFDFKLGEEEEDFAMLNHCREWYAITKQCSYRETRPIGS